MDDRYAKQFIAMRYWLLGRNYFLVLDAFRAWQTAQRNLPTVPSEFEAEVVAFEQLKPTLLEDYQGQAVAIYQGESVPFNHPLLSAQPSKKHLPVIAQAAQCVQHPSMKPISGRLISSLHAIPISHEQPPYSRGQPASILFRTVSKSYNHAGPEAAGPHFTGRGSPACCDNLM